MLLPLKQGLKHVILSMFTTARGVVMLLPLKQGLKQTVNEALENVNTDIAAQKTRYDTFNDDTGVGGALAVSCVQQPYLLSNIPSLVAEFELRQLAQVFQNPLFFSDAQGLDTFVSKHKNSISGDPLLAYEFCVAFRAWNGDGALSPENCCAKTDTLYGTYSITTNTAELVSAPVDTSLYAGGPLKLVVTQAITGNGKISLTGVTLKGEAWEGSATLDNNNAGDEVEVTPAIERTYPVKITKVVKESGLTAGAVAIKIRQPYEYSA